MRKRVGDGVFSGNYATTGNGRYVAETVASGSFANRITAGARSFRRIVTPLQAEINRHPGRARPRALPRGAARRPRHRPELALGDVIADATLLAGLVPNGLFVSIAVAYALGAIRLLRFGALVQQSNAIESLSQSTCCASTRPAR